MANGQLGTAVHPDLYNPEFTCKGNFRPVKLTSTNPLISEEAMLCAQSFANATGISLQKVVSEALLYWWDTEGSYTVSTLEKESN